MPQIGPLEILVVGVLALLVFGPEKLPDMARSVGRAVNQLKTMASEAKSEFDIGVEDKDKVVKNEDTPATSEAGVIQAEQAASGSETSPPVEQNVPIETPQPSSKESALVTRS